MGETDRPNTTQNLGFHTLEGCVDPREPESGTTIEIRIPYSDVQHSMKHNPGRAWQLTTADHVLREPERIYEGVRREGEDDRDGWCYVGRPKRVCLGSDRWIPLPKGCVYVVFVSSRFIAYEWRIEHADPDDPEGPAGCESSDRYGRLKWEK